MIHYSVEWIPKHDRYDCWNQYALTRYRWLSRVYLFEARHKYGKSKNRFRIREV